MRDPPLSLFHGNTWGAGGAGTQGAGLTGYRWFQLRGFNIFNFQAQADEHSWQPPNQEARAPPKDAAKITRQGKARWGNFAWRGRVRRRAGGHRFSLQASPLQHAGGCETRALRGCVGMPASGVPELAEESSIEGRDSKSTRGAAWGLQAMVFAGLLAIAAVHHSYGPLQGHVAQARHGMASPSDLRVAAAAWAP